MLKGSKTLFRAGTIDFQLRHLLIIAILAMAFSTAFIMRMYPAKYGFYLNEFDPFFDFRATKYIVDNGLVAYWNWHDTMSWHPDGRDIPSTSQSGLHITAAVLYMAFGQGVSVMDFTIMFPVVVGSLTTIVIFALVRRLGNSTTAGMFAAMLFAFSPAIIQRGNLGWFKSEPLGLFLGLLGVYFFISAIKHSEIKFAIAKAVAGGLVLGLANASWGGIQYFSIPIALFFVALPFFRKDLKIPVYVAIAFTAFTLISAVAFPRPGTSFLYGLPGLALIGGTLFLGIASFVRVKSTPKTEMRNTAIVLVGFIIVAASVLAVGAYASPSFRYLNAINPFLKSQIPLVESVAEHFTPTLVDYFLDFSILLMFAGFGAWIAFKRRDDMSIFVLILGITSIYVSATFARLLVFASVGVIVLSSLGIYEVTRSILETRQTSLADGVQNKPKIRKRIESSFSSTPVSRPVRIAYVIVIIFMLSLPTVYPPNANWVSNANIPPSIANGGTGFRLNSDDWINALEWISKNTPEDAVIASWWDYGYWITTLGNRTTLADNATINSTRIETIAQMFISEPERGIQIAQKLDADYIMLYVVGQRFVSGNNTAFYTLGSGGDESKKQWFMRIGGFDESNYVERDGVTPNPGFWNSTLLGKLMPFNLESYALQRSGVITNIQSQYSPGSLALYSKHIKYPENGTASQPLELVYSSDSFRDNDPGLVFGVLLYKVNRDYVPRPSSTPAAINETPPAQNSDLQVNANMTPSSEVATIKTAQGDIKLEFFPGAAPNHVDNFKSLAEKGFYDDTIFHRIVPGFVIQGGDPNTRPNGTGIEGWGSGGPGYSVDAEFNDIPHTKGILSMARTGDPNSAGSQFFIVLEDSRFLDNQYTVFGRVIEGMDVVEKIANVATIQSGENKDKPENADDARIESVTISARNG